MYVNIKPPFQAMLEIGPGKDNITTLNIDLMMGDRTGYLHMKGGQTSYLEYSQYSILRSTPPVNFQIDQGSQIWLSSDFKVIGNHVPAFQVGVVD
jgi:hypothetical protein